MGSDTLNCAVEKVKQRGCDKGVGYREEDCRLLIGGCVTSQGNLWVKI